MTSTALHPTPRWSVIAFEQFRSVGLRVRAAGVLLISALALYGGIVIRAAMSQQQANLAAGRHRFMSFEYTPEASVLLTYLALLLPALIWHEEGPGKRMYHLAMPINRSAHALTKVFAGWVWMMLATVVFLLAVVLVDKIVRQVIGAPFPPVMHLELWEWMVPFTTATIAYALSSAAAVGAKTPAVWIVGVPILYAATSILLGMVGSSSLSQSMLKVFSGYYGAGASLAGNVNGLNAVGAATGPDIGRWLVASGLWGVTAAVLLYVVSHRRATAQ